MSAEGINNCADADIDAEKTLLEAIKTANHLGMSQVVDDLGDSIADKTREKMGIEPNQSAELEVLVGPLKDGEGLPAGERILVQAAIKEAERPNQTTYKQIPAAKLLEGAVLPENGFADDQALALSGMVRGLKEVKKLGLLVRLEPNLTTINDPNTGMTKSPPLEAPHRL